MPLLPALDAILLVLRDMGIEGRPRRHDAEYVWVRLKGEPPLSIWLPEDEAPDLVHIAGQLQNDASETEAHWGQALPPCPGHTHALDPDRIAGAAWWLCPADRHRVARIGELHQLR